MIKSEFVYVVSNGSAKGNEMTYGWVMVSSHRKKIASGHRPCVGRPSYMRSEAAGVLSHILFLSTLQQITNNAMGKPIVRFMTDNQSLITRETQHQGYSEPYLNSTLKAEFDLIEQNFLTINEADIQATFQHIKGHQDDCTVYKLVQS